jgi:hypothetical protein
MNNKIKYAILDLGDDCYASFYDTLKSAEDSLSDMVSEDGYVPGYVIATITHKVEINTKIVKIKV